MPEVSLGNSYMEKSISQYFTRSLISSWVPISFSLFCRNVQNEMIWGFAHGATLLCSSSRRVHLAAGSTAQQVWHLCFPTPSPSVCSRAVQVCTSLLFITLQNHIWIWEFQPELTFITSLLFPWNCTTMVVMGYGVFCLLILHQDRFRLFKEPHFPEYFGKC